MDRKDRGGRGALAAVELCDEAARAERPVGPEGSAADRTDALLATVPGVVWEAVGDPDHPGQQIQFVSSHVERLLGYTVDEWLSTPNFWLAIVHPEDREQAARDAAETYQSAAQHGHSEFRWMTKDGRTIWVECQSTVVCDEAGQPVGMRGVTMDITERKRQQQRLQTTNDELHRTKDWLTFLSEASTALSSSLDYRTTLRSVANLTVPRIADWCIVHVADDGPDTDPMIIAHDDPERARWAREVLARVPLGAEHWRAFDVMRTGTPEVYPEMPDDLLLAAARTEEEADLLRRADVRSMLVLPLEVHDRALGAMTLLNGADRDPFCERDVDLYMHLARRCAQAMENARLYWRAKQEIAERTRAEEALRRSEERFSTAFRSSPTALFMSRVSDGMILDVNGRWEEIFGYPRESVVGRTYPVAGISRRPSDLERVNVLLEEQGRFTDVEMRLGTATGERDVRVSAESIRIDGAACVLGFVEDITDRQRAAEDLAAEKERLAVTLRSIADGVIATDTDGYVTLINPVAEALTGWTVEEAVGQHVGEVFHVFSRRTGLPAPVPVTHVLETGEQVGPHHHARLVSKDGTERIVEDSAAPIRDRDGRVVGVVLVLRDVTRQERIETELRRTSKLDSLGVLAGGIAHDFNNLLTAILANLSIATVEAGADSPLSVRLAKAERAALRARDLTQQLLTFAKGGDPIRRPTTLRELVVESAMFALAGTTVSTDIHFGDGLWSAEVDAGQIAQVIQNLAINAQQAMPAGGRFSLRASNRVLVGDEGLPLAPGRYVRIEIADQGGGIPAAALPQIFDPFFTTKPHGSGLGLATAYAIIQKHSGHIRVERTDAEGTTFCVYLPASEHQVTAVEPEALLWRGRGRVLAMDDEPIMRETLLETLRAIGFEAVAVRDGGEALVEYAAATERGEPFDAVILDLTVPGGLGGRETIGRLLEMDPEVRGIVSSGYSDDPVMSRFRDHGFCGVVAKPYTLAELRATLRAALEGR